MKKNVDWDEVWNETQKWYDATYSDVSVLNLVASGKKVLLID
jgi:hypothetical protein